uniref:3-ketoacyl-CoA thiolase, mitochondrial-like n=1 Tax=Phallusia mammillata TaxID=59560 RepID=A0A6F9D6C4_9ASCI|nr:3-ketoacyl-CoA thiolase, mitochondrial-like [Phallusia mammillata]
MSSVVIVSAVRTPIGTLTGNLATVPSYTLGSIVIEEVLKRAEVNKDDVCEVIMGQVLTAGQGQNPARHASLLAGLPHKVPALTVNQVCGASLRAIALAFQAIKCGDAKIVVAGGQESMSMAPHCVHMRAGVKMGNTNLVDTMVEDGLKDCIHKCSMLNTAENIAQRWKISRKDQDEFTYSSQMKAAEALKSNQFEKEIIPVTVKGRKEITVSVDEFPRPQTTMETLSKLKPIGLSDDDKLKGITGSVTVANATGVNNGAAAVLVMSSEEAQKRSLSPLAKIVSWAHAGVDPLIMGTGPIPAISKAVEKAGWKIEEVDLFEINEAFAAQSLAVVQELGIDLKKLNVRGGALALGHPLGATGCRLVVTLLHAMVEKGAHKGVAALCVGGGMGVALCVEM